MKKLKELEIDYKRFRVPGIYNNKYNYLFDQNRIYYGQSLYMHRDVDDLKINGDEVTAVVHGTKDYKVKIIFLPNDEIDVSCECPYHKETTKYCKHVYAVLVAVHMKDLKEQFIKEYHENVNRITEIMNDYANLIKDNSTYLDAFTIALLSGKPESYQNNIKKIEEEFDPSLDYKIIRTVEDSFLYLRLAIENYNFLVDCIIRDKQKYEEYQEKKKKEEARERYLEQQEEKKERFYNSLPSDLDDMSIMDLKSARRRARKEGIPTRDIDRVIKEKQRYKDLMHRAIISGIFSGLFSDSGTNTNSSPDLNPWEQDFIDSNAYEPFQFEEEDLEEDDFYYEDD